HDWRDIAPRVAVAWAPGSSTKNPRPKTVLRAGFGTFYERFALAHVLNTERYNGLNQQQFVISNPDFFPTIPSPATLHSTQVIQAISSSLRAPYYLQGSVTLERQLPANVTVALTYATSHGLHLLRTRDINAPLPGTYDRSVPGSGVFPLA